MRAAGWWYEGWHDSGTWVVRGWYEGACMSGNVRNRGSFGSRAESALPPPCQTAIETPSCVTMGEREGDGMVEGVVGWDRQRQGKGWAWA